MDEDVDTVMKRFLSFLGADNYCSVYPARPKACREYPHDHTKMKNLNLLEKTWKLSSAQQIVDRITKDLGLPSSGAYYTAHYAYS